MYFLSFVCFTVSCSSYIIYFLTFVCCVLHFLSFASREEKNFIEAASNGASLAISLVANIAANLIAFIALLHFVDSTLTWFGHRAGLYEPELTFQVRLYICCVVQGKINPDK